MQLGLFGSNEEARSPTFARESWLSEQLPSQLRFGTSSWTFEGWSDIVYPHATRLAELRRRGLELYCKNPLFRSVGIDSSYYRPLSAGTLKRYAEQLPKGFRCVTKVPREITQRFDPSTLTPNPSYLNPARFEREVLGPIGEAFADHQGPLLLQFPELSQAPAISPTEFARSLSQFFSRVSHGFEYAVELRDRLLLHPRYVEALQRHGVAHAFNYWERMPELSEQRARVDLDSAGFGLVRLLIPPGQRYAERKRRLEPFDRIASVQRGMRQDTLDLMTAFSERNRPLYVIANNKAEGSSPLTIAGLAEEWAELRAPRDGRSDEPSPDQRGAHDGAGSPSSSEASPKRA